MKVKLLLLLLASSNAYKLYQRRSPLQQPDEIAWTGVQIPQSTEISDSDIKAYSIAVSNGGNAASMLKEMAPKPVKAEEDIGSIAAFMETISDKNNSNKE